MYIPKTRFVDIDYSAYEVLIAPCESRLTPIMGTILYDDACDFTRVRDYRSRKVRYPAVCCYRIENALISSDFVVHRDNDVFIDSSLVFCSRKAWTIEQATEILSSKIAKVDGDIIEDYANEDVVVMHNEGGGTWGHHLIHNTPRILLYLQSYPNGKVVIPSTNGYNYTNFGRIFEAYGIEGSRVLPLIPNRTYKFSSVSIVDFLYNFEADVIHPTALSLLKPLSDDMSDQPCSKKLWINRPQSNFRAVENISDLTSCLNKHAIEPVILGKSSIAEQIAAWSNADIVVCVLGSDLANIIFARPRTKILSLSPHWFGDNFCYNLAVAKGLQWNELRCGTMTTKRSPIYVSDFKVDIDMLDTMLTTIAKT